MTDARTAPQPPLLGVSGRWGQAEVAVTRKFDELHQMIYRRGGIRPTNAAVEELAKIIFLRLWALRDPDAEIRSGVRICSVFDGTALASVDDIKAAFAGALRVPLMTAQVPGGGREPIWPLDEPFRLESQEVLDAAVALIAEVIRDRKPSVSDPFGTAFDALLSGRYDHAGGLGTYLTPSSVAQMMALIGDLLLTEMGNRLDADSIVGDPFCGTGRFLVALEELFGSGSADRTVQIEHIFGADTSSSAVAKARMNLMLYGSVHPLVWRVSDSIVDPHLTSLEGKVDLILTNPPFGEGKYDDPAGIRQTAEAIPSFGRRARIDPAVAGIVRCLRLLKPGGVVGIVLPDGVIESRAFAELLDGGSGTFSSRVAVAANISLPTVTFALSGTVAKTSAMFLQLDKKPRCVALARVDHVGYLRQAGRATEDPSGNELPTIPELVGRGLRAAGGVSLTVQSEAPLVACVAADATTSIHPSRIDPLAVESRAAVSASGGVELATYVSAKPRTPRGRIGVDAPFVSVLHVDDLGTVAWHEAETYRPTTPGKIAESGELIVSLLNPSTLRAAVIPDRYREVQVSGEFGIFTCREDPYGILALLHSEDVRNQLRPLGRGTSSSRRRIDGEDVLNLLVPSLSAQEFTELARLVRSAVEGVATGRRSLFEQFEGLRRGQNDVARSRR